MRSLQSTRCFVSPVQGTIRARYLAQIDMSEWIHDTVLVIAATRYGEIPGLRCRVHAPWGLDGEVSWIHQPCHFVLTGRTPHHYTCEKRRDLSASPSMHLSASHNKHGASTRPRQDARVCRSMRKTFQASERLPHSKVYQGIHKRWRTTQVRLLSGIKRMYMVAPLKSCGNLHHPAEAFISIINRD